MSQPRPLVYQKLQPMQEADSAMIVFHGYGDSSRGFVPFARDLQGPLPNMAFYLADAPLTMFPGVLSWFHIPDEFFSIRDLKGEHGLELVHRMTGDAKEVLPSVHDLIGKVAEESGIPYEKIILAGFSQGGLISLLAGMTFPSRLGGLVAMSSIPVTFGPHFSPSEVVSRPDVLLTHSRDDEVAPFASMAMNRRTLEEAGIRVYATELVGLGHNYSISYDVLDSVAKFSIRSGSMSSPAGPPHIL